MFTHVFLHNPLHQWLLAAAIVVVTVLAVRLVTGVGTRVLRRLAERTRTHWDDALVEALASTRLWLIALAALHPAVHVLTLPEAALRFAYGTATVAFFLQIGLWAAQLLHIWITRTREHARQHDPAALTSLGAVSFIARVGLWAIVALLALDNLGINVSALVAGLGVGGIAIGLAVQNILGDLFASLSIVLDKPFVVGDFIIVDSFRGTVENIGIKTTRVRSLDGELLVFSNGDLTKSRLRNYKHMQERRILFTIGVVYQTSADQLEAIPGIIREAIEAQPQTRFDRAHFSAFGASSLDFEIVYWMLVPDYNRYMDTQQAINLELVRRFEKAGIEFAFPSRTLYFGQPLEVTGGRGAAPAPVRGERDGGASG
ncbi:MAG: mechanosensitive ion channel family protein [Gammaproteobacteria bacterium]|nr:mechanosensitive ion channel family protein [Gammaproteobacteria bacterium]